MPLSQQTIDSMKPKRSKPSLEDEATPYERKWTMVIDLDRCTGCHACEWHVLRRTTSPSLALSRLIKAGRTNGFVLSGIGRASIQM